MIDIGIDWEARYGSGWIRRFSAAPVFEAGASLLCGAALLWKGRYGQGRVVGKSARALASSMRDLGEHWRTAGLRWTATLLTDYGLSHDASHLLFTYRDRRGCSPSEGGVRKHPHAARRLAEAALTMGSDRLSLIRDTSKALGGTHNDADTWEDRFEALGETPLGTPPDPPLSASERKTLEQYAIYRTCQSLASMAAVIISSGGDRRLDQHAPDASKPWHDASSEFARRAKATYEAFVHDETHDSSEREPLLAALDTASPDISYSRHYADNTAIHGAAAVVALYVNLLLHAAGDAENPLDTRAAFKNAGLKLSTKRHLALAAAEL